MARYVIRAPRAAEWESAGSPLPHPTVYDGGPVNTGLVDADGNPIYRVRDRIGFLTPPFPLTGPRGHG